MNDLTGRSQLLRNIATSWVVQAFVLVAGFIIPRQISDELGMVALGTWDLGWSTFRYFTLANLGSTAALTRFTGLFNARGEHERLSQYVSIVTLWQLAVSGVIVLFAIGLFVLTPEVLSTWTDGSRQAILLIYIFSCAVALKMLGDPGGGIISGFHRWDIQHSINGLQDVGIAIGVIVVLIAGGGLTELAYVVFIVTAAATLIRIGVARALFPNLTLTHRHWALRPAIESFRFAVKSIVNTAPVLLIFQTAALVLAAAAGPGALAILSRSISLLRIGEQMVRRVSNMFTPMTSGLMGLERNDEARSFLLVSCKVCMTLTLICSLGLLTFGDLVIRIWMGDEYVNRAMMAALVTGSILPIANTGPFGVLAGMNAHGKLGIWSLIIAVVSITTLLGAAWALNMIDPVTVALIIGVAWSLSRGLTVPIFLRLRYQIPLVDYVREGVAIPLLVLAPAAGFLYFCRIAVINADWTIALSTLLLAGVSTIALGWKLMLPESMRAGVRSAVLRRLGR